MLLTVLFGYTLFSVAINNFKDSYFANSRDFARSYSLLMTRNNEYQTYILNDLNEQLLATNSLVLLHRDDIDNTYLEELTEIMQISVIWWYDPDGVIIHDSSGEFIGWSPTEGDPIDDFMKSGETIRLDGIRKSTEDDRHYLTAYKRAGDGFFVQTAIDAENVLKQLQSFSYENAVSEVKKSNENVLFASILDLDFNRIAHSENSDLLECNIDYGHVSNINAGQTVSFETYCEEQEATIVKVFTPIIVEGELVAILSLGYSLDFVNEFAYYLSLVLTTLALVIILSYMIMQYFEIIRPLGRLNESLKTFDKSSGKFIKPEVSSKSLGNLYETFEDLSETISNSINELENVANTDYLTDIPNRFAFEKELKQALETQENFAVLFIDVDDFKNYNDVKGHVFGDNLLKKISLMIKKLQDEHGFFLSRYGGDEFVVIKSFDSNKEIDLFCSVIFDIFAFPIEVEESDYNIDLSIGISVYPSDGKSVDELVRKADIAMYESKSKTKNMHVYYNELLESRIIEENSILTELKKALRNDGFKIVIQPQYCVDSNEILSYEALARFKHIDLSPYKFIKAAEDVNLINSIGRVVIEKAILLLAELKKDDQELKTIYVNVSAKQLSDETLISYIKKLLEIHKIEPHYLGVELTESSIIENITDVKKFLGDLSSLGVKIALDDFGSGQAGINYLSQFPVELVKLDRSFCNQYLTNESIIVFKKVVELAQLLNFDVLAEGIETKEQIDLLKTTDCRRVQGYYYSKPFEANKLLKKKL